MRISTRLCTRALMIALAMVLSTSALFAASPLVWEAENVKDLSGKAFFISKLTTDPSRYVSGKSVLRLPKVPEGEKIARDEVSYKVNIPANGTYYLWARVRWTNGCGNSFLMKLPNVAGEQILGGDGTYDILLWKSLNDGGRPRPLTLKKGVMTFTLISKESGTMADQFLLTTDRKYTPAGIYKATSDLLK